MNSQRLACEHSYDPLIVILGLGNLLYTDEGLGVHVVDRLKKEYDFPSNVSLVDGGVLGLHLMSVISQADRLIVIDAIKNSGSPGSVYRIKNSAICKRIRAKNSMHQVDFLETLSVCNLINKVPDTVLVGVEPANISTMRIGLTPVVEASVIRVMELVLEQVGRWGISSKKRSTN